MLIEKFLAHIAEKHPYLNEKKILVACSGGKDSVVLAHLIAHGKFEFGLAHCNFSLRGGESDEDELFVENLSKKFGVPFYSERFDTSLYAKDKKISIQMAARELRYAWFDEIRTHFGYDYVLTAHHLDDDLETFLINLSRGTGIRGLSGIPPKSENVVRPLLPFSRQEILAFAKRHQLYWREDSSNEKNDYLRNALRNQVIPEFKKAASNILEGFSKTHHHLLDSQLLVEDYMALVYNLAVTENFDGYTIHIEKLRELPNTNALLYEMLHPFHFTAWNDVFSLLKAQSGKTILSPTHKLTKDRGVLLLTERAYAEEISEVEIPENTTIIRTPIKLRFEEVRKLANPDNNNSCLVAKEKLTFPLRLRKWKEGDAFQPFGMRGKKKLSKFFKDEKVSLVAKANVYVLCDSDDQIVWVVGYRMDDHFKVEPTTETILKITYLS
ncbi:MAG: tRNA lysidine(34) synthetase TilS [Flavobacteriaceae bacterium]|nr:tRNA lysidine(34) synthetase TilS [Flavobacteriaceae bacterium]